MTHIGQRLADYYNRARDVICVETSVVLPIGIDYSPRGFSRTVESELRIESDGDDPRAEPKVVRHIRKVNGRTPNERDKKDRSGCTDPEPLGTEPLTFLLPEPMEQSEV